jgi:hypothetical protein
MLMLRRTAALGLLLLLPAVAACQPLTLAPDEAPDTNQPVTLTSADREPASSTALVAAPPAGASAPVTDVLQQAPVTSVSAEPLTQTLEVTDTMGMEMGSATAMPASEAMTDTVSAGELEAMSAAMPPANPLTTLEQERATALALGSPTTEEVVANAIDRDAVNSTSMAAMDALSERPSYRVLYSQRAPDKFAVGRGAEVAIYRYDTDQSLLNTVDLINGAVSASMLPEGYILPLVTDEITEATTVAKADPKVVDALRQANMDPALARSNALLTQGTTPDSPCAKHRCLRLFFSTETSPAPTFSVIVDISELSVVEVIPFDIVTGSEDQ